jgi:hypothetical protein
MVRCDACGELHREDDCEIVIVKFVKGKACKLELGKTSQAIMPQPLQPVQNPSSTSNVPANFEGAVPVKRRAVIPPGIVGLMEQDGAIITRKT